MKAALIAAGLGERLAAAGIRTAKPLVAVGGVPLVDRVFEAVAATSIREVACIFRSSAAAVEEHCRRGTHGLRLEIVRRDTDSSMESLFTLAPLLVAGRFLLLTVDAVFAPETLARFVGEAAAEPEADVVLALTSFVDDEKPLRVRTDARGRVDALGAQAAKSPLVTAGFYVIHPRVFDEIDAARRARLTALRQFLGHLLARDYRMHGVRVGKTIDVDRPEDIAAAERFVLSGFVA